MFGRKTEFIMKLTLLITWISVGFTVPAYAYDGSLTLGAGIGPENAAAAAIMNIVIAGAIGIKSYFKKEKKSGQQRSEKRKQMDSIH